MTSENEKKTKLAELITIKHGYAFKGSSMVDYATNEVLVTPGNFAIGGGFKSSKLKYHSGVIPDGYILEPGQLVVTMTDLSKESDTLGYSALVPDDDYTYLHNQRIGLVKIKDETVLDKLYLYFLMRSPSYRHEVLASSTGTSVKHSSPSKILNFEFVLPNINIQRKVAGYLYSLELKIANNTAMNQTLEKIAQRIFKSWFIDFDPVKANKEGVAFDGLSPEIQALFPNEFEESELGMVPKGWIPSTIGEEFDLVMGQSPKGTSYNEDAEGTVFFQGRRDFNFRFPSVRVYTTEPKKIAKQGDTLLSVRAPVGDVNIALEECCVGRGLAALRHKSNCSSLTYYTVANLKRIFDSFDTEGTVFGSINQKDLKSLKVIKMSEDVASAFSKVISPLDERIKQNTQNTICLERLRDRLLPKLISGQITVGEAQKELAEAI
ncbi:restriction endonuclease subunit S [Vibrio vulnificus]|nr:restriction endonuclease subunit S [Vibrio vulnificus]